MTDKNEIDTADENIEDARDSALVQAYRAAMIQRAPDRPDAAADHRQHGMYDVHRAATMQYICRQYDRLSGGAFPEQVFDFRPTRKLGEGGQGVVRLTECRGSDGFENSHLALKVFSPRLYPSMDAYEADMHRIGRVASIVAGIDQGNILNVQRFDTFEGVRLMLMKQVEGYDLRRLLDPWSVNRVREVRPDLWDEINTSIANVGQFQTMFKPGAALSIVRSCLIALDRLHSRGVVYGDIKPSNIMLSPEGEVKIVDIGSAFESATSRQPYFCTPEYAAPEVLDQGECTPQSDLASLGYVLIEMLLGRPVFSRWARGERSEHSVPQEATTGIPPAVDERLVEEKRLLPERLDELLPSYSPLLCEFLRKLIAPDPRDRFPNAREADVAPGCSGYVYYQQLVRSRLDMHYQNEFRVWLEAIGPSVAS